MVRRYITSEYDTMHGAMKAAMRRVDESEAELKRLQAIREWTELREARLRCFLNLATVGFPPESPTVVTHPKDAARDKLTTNTPAWAGWIRMAGREGCRWDDDMRNGARPFLKRIDGPRRPKEGRGFSRGRQLLRLAYSGCKRKFLLENLNHALEDFGAERGNPRRQAQTGFGILGFFSELSRNLSLIVRESHPREDLICYAAAARGDAANAHLLCPGVPILRIKGGTTEILFERRAIHVKTSTGIRQLKALVDQQHKAVSALDLMRIRSRPTAAISREIGDRRQEDDVVHGQQGRQLVTDKKAKLERNARLAKLPQEIASAIENGEGDLVAELKEEKENLERQRNADRGLGGRTRAFVGDREKARQAVNKTIDAAIRSIKEQDAALAAHFDDAVRRGSDCVYDPPTTPH